MKKSFLVAALLAAVAGGAGVLIGVAVRHARPLAVARKAAEPVPTPASIPASSESSDPDTGGSAKVSVIRFVRNPTPAPLFSLSDLDGKAISIAGLQGKVVLLNFWATWCPPCREEIPQLVALANRYKDRLQIIGVSMDEDASPEEVKAFAAKQGINYPIVMAGSKIADQYGGVPALPTSFLLNSDGRIVQKHVGLFPPNVFDGEVRSLLGLSVNAKVETFEDTGQIFLKNADRATEFPGVDLKGLTAEQKTAVIKQLNSKNCTCGCDLTIAQCRINDSTCSTSKGLARKVVKQAASSTPPASSPTAQNGFAQ